MGGRRFRGDIKIPKWKRWLSYLYEFSIETVPSQWSGDLHVFLSRGRLQLCAPGSIYSYDDLYLNFKIAFDKIQLPESGKSVLVLGLGLGSIPLILERQFGKSYHFTIVEIDEAVIHLANKYTLSQLKSPIEVIQADALNYIYQCDQQFDLICMDVFLDDVIPAQFRQHYFLLNLKTCLAEDGILLYNCLAAQKKDIELARNFLERYFQVVFEKGIHLEVAANWILMNDRRFLKAGASAS